MRQPMQFRLNQWDELLKSALVSAAPVAEQSSDL